MTETMDVAEAAALLRRDARSVRELVRRGVLRRMEGEITRSGKAGRPRQILLDRRQVWDRAAALRVLDEQRPAG